MPPKLSEHALTVALVRRSRRGPADSELTCDTAHSARGKDRGHDRVRALRPDLRTARVMGRAMPSPLARSSSDLLTNWSHGSSTNWTTSARSPAEDIAAAFTPPRPRPPRAIRPNGLRRPDACHPPGVRTTGWLRYEGHGSKASAKPTRDKGIGMRKAHRHHHTDGMARAVGTSGSSASIWARTHRSGRGLRRGSRFG